MENETEMTEAEQESAVYEVPADTVETAESEFEKSELESEMPDETDYKEDIRKLKAAYKAQKRARKQQQKEASAQDGSSTYVGRTIVVSVVSTLLVLLLFFAVLLCFPNPKNSSFHHLVKRYAQTAQSRYPTQPDTSLEGKKISAGDSVTIEVDGEIATAAVYAKAAKSVVGIEVRMLSGARWETATETVVSQGSGVIYSADGMVLTNYHVIEAAVDAQKGTLGAGYKVVVYFDTDLSEAYEVKKLVGFDSDCDLALLKVEAAGLTPIRFADSDALSVGEPVVAIGSPGGLEFMNSVSEGIISGLDRDITSSSTGSTVYELIQTTAAINPGNSGGALLNRTGELIGICVIKIVSTNYEGMGFAINSNTAGRIVRSFLQYGKYVRPSLGIEVDTRYNASAANAKQWPAGAYVATVSKGSAAETAGIRPDDIICEVAGVRVQNFSALRKQLLRQNPGDTITLKIYRPSADQYLDIQVKLNASS